MARLLLVPSLLVALALIVKGYTDVGDGFAAGVVAALAVLFQYAAFGPRETARRLPVRLAPALALAGLLVALVVGFVPLLLGDPLLSHYPGAGANVVHVGTLELLTAVAFDFGVFLLVLGTVVGAIDAVARTHGGAER